MPNKSTLQQKLVDKLKELHNIIKTETSDNKDAYRPDVVELLLCTIDTAIDQVDYAFEVEPGILSESDEDLII